MDHVGRSFAPGDGHGHEPLVDPERFRRRDHDRTLHDPVPAAGQDKEADDVGGDELEETNVQKAKVYSFENERNQSAITAARVTPPTERVMRPCIPP